MEPLVFLIAVVACGGFELPPFTDQSAALPFTHTSSAPPDEPYLMTPGLAAADFNRDGWIDLLVQGGLGQNAGLFINNQDGTFTDRAAEWGIDLSGVEGASVDTLRISYRSTREIVEFSYSLLGALQEDGDAPRATRSSCSWTAVASSSSGSTSSAPRCSCVARAR